MAGLPERPEWTDKRLDDRFAELRREMDRLAVIADALIEVPGKLADVVASSARCRDEIVLMNARMDRREEEEAQRRIAALEQREEEQQAAKAEKKKDRRWFAGIIITASGVIVAAVGILLSALT